MILFDAHLLALLLIAGNAIIWAQVIRKDLIQINADYERNKRALDFGLFVRNLLLKSATASNGKANISRNIINLKAATPAPTRRTTTTTTVAPFLFNKGPFRFPFDLSGPINNKFNNNGGFINFDYNDYGGQQPVRPGRRRRPTTTTTTTTTTAAPPPPPPSPPATPQRRPIPRRPFGLFGKQKVPFFDYYDYDYNYDDVDNRPTSTAPPNPPPSPRPPPARPIKRPTANAARAQGRVPQLRNRFVYQFRQPDDTSTNNAAAQPANDKGSPSPTNNNSNNSNNEETSTNTNDYTDDVYDNEGEDINNVADDTNPNVEQDSNDSSDNANPNVSPAPPLLQPNSDNFNANLPAAQGQSGFRGYVNSPSGFGNFGPSEGFPYPPYNDFNSQYQQLSPAAGYSVRYY